MFLSSFCASYYWCWSSYHHIDFTNTNQHCIAPTDSCVIFANSTPCVGRCSPDSHSDFLGFFVSSVIVWMLGYRVNDRREDVQHEDHWRCQARHEKDCGRAGPPLTQKPRAEGGSGGGVWCELSWHAAWERQGRPETAFTNLGEKRQHITELNTLTPTHTLTGTVLTGHRWTPCWRMCNLYFWAMWCFYKYHACCRVDISERLFGLFMTFYICGPLLQSLYLFVRANIW